MSYGTGPFGTFGFGLPLSPSVADRGTIVSSRAIDSTGRFVESGDEAGSYAGMTDTRQRVYILCALAVQEPVKQTADLESTMDKRIRTALRPLTHGAGAVIKLLSVDVTRSPNGTKKLVRYRDLTDGEAYETEV
jgi:hypothetical protein